MKQRWIAGTPNHLQPDTRRVKLCTLTWALKTYQTWPWSSRALKHMLYLKHVRNPIRVNEIQHKPLDWISEYLGCGPDYVSDRPRNLGQITVLLCLYFLFCPLRAFTMLHTISTKTIPFWNLLETALLQVMTVTLMYIKSFPNVCHKLTLPPEKPQDDTPYPYPSVYLTTNFKRRTLLFRSGCEEGIQLQATCRHRPEQLPSTRGYEPRTQRHAPLPLLDSSHRAPWDPKCCQGIHRSVCHTPTRVVPTKRENLVRHAGGRACCRTGCRVFPQQSFTLSIYRHHDTQHSSPQTGLQHHLYVLMTLRVFSHTQFCFCTYMQPCSTFALAITLLGSCHRQCHCHKENMDSAPNNGAAMAEWAGYSNEFQKDLRWNTVPSEINNSSPINFSRVNISTLLFCAFWSSQCLKDQSFIFLRKIRTEETEGKRGREDFKINVLDSQDNFKDNSLTTILVVPGDKQCRKWD